MRWSIQNFLITPIVCFTWRTKIVFKLRRPSSSAHFIKFYLFLLISTNGWINIFIRHSWINWHCCSSMIKRISFFYSLSTWFSYWVLLPIGFIRRNWSHIITLFSLIILKSTTSIWRDEITHITRIHSILYRCTWRIYLRRNLVIHKSYQWWLL